MSSAPLPYRPEFEAALRLLARISEAMEARGCRPPVLVGGGAVEIYTKGRITTGDFDLSCGRQDVLEAVMQDLGFVRPSGAGVATRGWVHPELQLGFECVSDTLLDGMADREMIQIVRLDEQGAVAIIGPEDMIADRMGQYASGSAPEMLGQARALFTLSERLDIDYIWSDEFARKRSATMVFKTFKTKREPISLAELSQRIDRRRGQVGEVIVPRNSGTRRTASKRALLKAIEDAGGKW